MRLSAAVITVATLGMAAPAWAQDSADAPVSTASAVSSYPDTEAQIRDYLASSPVIRTPADRFYGDGPLETLDEDGKRKIHGEVSVGVGTGGYRSGAVSAVIPIGEDSTLALSFRKTDFGKGGGYFHEGYAPGYGYGMGEAYVSDSLVDERSGLATCSTAPWDRDRGNLLTGRLRSDPSRC